MKIQRFLISYCLSLALSLEASCLSPLYRIISMDKVEAMKKAIQNGFDLDAISPLYGKTPLMAAAFFGRYQICLLLLEAGADVEKAGRQRITPLAEAACKGYHRICKLLLTYGANPNAREGRSPLRAAYQNGHYQICSMFILHEPPTSPQDLDIVVDVFESEFSKNVRPYCRKGYYLSLVHQGLDFSIGNGEKNLFVVLQESQGQKLAGAFLESLDAAVAGYVKEEITADAPSCIHFLILFFYAGPFCAEKLAKVKRL